MTVLPLRSRLSLDSPRRHPLASDFEHILRNSSAMTSRESLTARSTYPRQQEGLLELTIGRGAKTMQLAVRGLTHRELALLVSELGLREMTSRQP